MNCFDYRKTLSVTVSVSVQLKVKYTAPRPPEGEPTDTFEDTSYEVNGSKNFMHTELYQNWTRRELACTGAPILSHNTDLKKSYVLRSVSWTQMRFRPFGFLVCNESDGEVQGLLTQESPMTLEITGPGKDLAPPGPLTLQFWIPPQGYIYDQNQPVIADPVTGWMNDENLLQPGMLYPALENDPYSIARTRRLDYRQSISDPPMYIGLSEYTRPSPMYYFMSGYEINDTWSDESGTETEVSYVFQFEKTTTA